MATYSVAQARNNIADLIDRALNGEEVTITRHGRRMVDLVPSDNGSRTIDVEWFRRNRVIPDHPAPPDPDGLHIVERMRLNDEL